MASQLAKSAAVAVSVVFVHHFEVVFWLLVVLEGYLTTVDVDVAVELEVVDDKWIFANAFTTNLVYQIDIKTGKVVNKWNMQGLQER